MMIMSLFVAVFIGERTQADDALCPRLFTSSSASSVQSSPASRKSQGPQTTLDLSGLNGPSREFVVRLNYLILDRRVLAPGILAKISASPQPFNPLGDRASSVMLHPHQLAFAQLLNENLQWDLIQQTVHQLAGTHAQENRREETAVRETQETLVPVLIKTLPFAIESAVRTETGRSLGINVKYDPPTHTTTLTTTDLASGDPVSSLSYGFATTKFDDMSLQGFGTTALASLPDLSSHRLVTFDLVNQRAIPSDSLGTIAPSKPVFFQMNGQLTAATFQDKNMRLIDPLTGNALGPEIQLSPERFKTAEKKGVIGNRLYAAGGWTGSFFIDPSGSLPVRENPRFKTLTAFQHQGKTYGIGLDVQATFMNQSDRHIRVFDFDSDEEFPEMKFFSASMDLIRILDIFEQDGRPYGVIATPDDLVVADLFAGKVTATLTDTPLGPRMFKELGILQNASLAFTHKGKPYLLATLANEQRSNPPDLVILDATTLLPLPGSLRLPKAVSSIIKVPQSGSDIWFLINFKDGTSGIVSLLNRI